MAKEKRRRYTREARTATLQDTLAPGRRQPSDEPEEKRRPTGRGGGAPRPGESVATERPVLPPPAPRTSEYVVTIENRTGLTVKIEKFDPATGARRELSPDEYVLIYPGGRPPAAHAVAPPVAAARPTAPQARPTVPVAKATPARRAAPKPLAAAAAATPTLAAPDPAALVEAYYRGVADYIKALSST